MIETTIDGKKVMLYDHIGEWIDDFWDLDFLNEFGVDTDNIVDIFEKYIIEKTIPTNWYEMHGGSPYPDPIEIDGKEYICVDEQCNEPVFLLEDNFDEACYLVYFDNKCNYEFKAFCNTYDNAVKWIQNRVTQFVQKLADEIKAWAPANGVEKLAENLNDLEVLIDRFSSYDGFPDDINHYVDTSGFGVPEEFEEKFQLINNPAWGCDSEGVVLLNDPDRDVDDRWYVRDLDELVKEKYGDEEA